MTRIGILLGGIALVAASATHAQRLGGGIGGGIGGMAGGGIGGVTGGLGGSLGSGFGSAMGGVNGDLQGSLQSQQLRDAAHADRIRARELRAQDKAARHSPVNASIGGGLSGSVSAVTAAGAGSVAGGAAGSVAGSVAPVATATGTLRRDAPPLDARAVDVVRGRSFAVRAEAEAGQRGLRRVGRSVTGVAVYVPAVAAPRVVYGGGGTYVSGGGYYDGGYYGGGGVSAPPVPVDDRQYQELQRDTAGTGVTVERRGADLVMELPADVTFAFNHADIQPRFVPALDAVARTIAAYPATDVEVIGHTDAVGSDAYNFALSQRRGASVADFLVSRHTDPQRLVVEGLGKTEPVASNATVTGRAANRRVEIVLHGQAA